MVEKDDPWIQDSRWLPMGSSFGRLGLPGVLCFYIPPGRLTWNLQITNLERKMIFQTPMIMFHVNLQGCNHHFHVGINKSSTSKPVHPNMFSPSVAFVPNLVHTISFEVWDAPFRRIQRNFNNKFVMKISSLKIWLITFASISIICGPLISH